MEGCECGRDKSGSELVRICIGRKRIQTDFELVWHFASVDRPFDSVLNSNIQQIAESFTNAIIHSMTLWG